ncbi:uncharacterized protein BCR38DRAFT_408795 [Pseudomassariella vexata]|uniref:C2H2-type domain-containing protein n=1 Tax=Pseudomassariella vexata TaxID=1141098 RepID=A0A1Y2E0J2_9PEZI|nr:uncharacterized protein BCR38DRAFT_408795 [Pseudomassariella vexata]ORY65052.1 hypothetical protein BCR38DRAFT_408795 [Pseudomassariella vexata]
MEPKKIAGVGVVPATDNPFLEHGASTTRQSMLASPIVRRQSRSSLHAEFRRASISCVTREATGENCAKQKFIVWAAVKRNRSVRIAPEERLECPLWRCRERFDDHEQMLQHVAGCQHLATGAYFCHDCMRVEKFNDAKCKCCLGQPTKRRRIINMAKNFFNKVGHKSRKDGPIDFESEDFAIAPPSYESLDIAQQLQDQSQTYLEMEATEILEMDGDGVGPAQLDSINYEPQPGNIQNHLTLGHAESWSMTNSLQGLLSVPPKSAMSQLHEPVPSSVGNKPLLAIDTHNIGPPRKAPRPKHLSPSSSLRSNNSSQNISPISAGSGDWTMASTIDTTLTSPITPFSPPGLDSMALSRENSCRFPKDRRIHHNTDHLNGFSWPRLDDKTVPVSQAAAQKSDNYTLDNIAELPGDNPENLAIPRICGEDPFLFSFEPNDNYSWSSSMNTEANVLFTSDDLKVPAIDAQTEQEAASSETKPLVGSTWEVLEHHISSSVGKTTHLRGNPLASRLQSVSAKEVAMIGLSALKRLLAGTEPTDPFDYLCFVHVTYAFSLIIHEDDLASRCNELFEQALAYRGFLNPSYHDVYAQIVFTIWQPIGHEVAGAGERPSSRLLSQKGKEPELRSPSRSPVKPDTMVVIAQNFLDDLEYSVVNSYAERPIEILTSDLWSMHISEHRPNASPTDAFAITVRYIVQVLNQTFPDVENQSLSQKLMAINQRVNAGYITTVRKLELELLQAGKNSMASFGLFDKFIPQVRDLCDPIYLQGMNPRKKYHTLGVSLMESLILNMGTDKAPPPEFQMTLPVGLESLDFDFLELGKAFGEETLGGQPEQPDLLTLAEPLALNLEAPMDFSMEQCIEDPVGNTTKSPIDTSTSKYKSTVDPTSLTRISASTHTSTASHSESPSETLKASMANSPDLSRPASEGSRATKAGSSGDLGSSQKMEAGSCCELCRYRPRGDPQWFKGSMAKHMKLQHSPQPPKIYKCSFPGCTSQYKNRPDNLRQHQIEKGHFVEGVDDKGRRPSKRKKMDD